MAKNAEIHTSDPAIETDDTTRWQTGWPLPVGGLASLVPGCEEG